MRASKVHVEPLFVRPDEAEEMLGSRQVLAALCKASKLKPIVTRNRLTLYAVADLRRVAGLIAPGAIEIGQILDRNQETQPTA